MTEESILTLLREGTVTEVTKSTLHLENLERRRLLGMASAVLALPLFESVLPTSVLAAPPPPDLNFRALYEGSSVGTHSVSFRGNNDHLIVTSQIDIIVKVMFFTAYRFEHEAVEVWRSDRLISVESTTNDNGEQRRVSGQATDEGFHLDSTDGPFLADSTLLTTNTLWNSQLVEEDKMIDVQNGGETGLVVKPLGREPVVTPQGQIMARRFRIITTDYAGSLYFDDAGRWVKSLIERQGEVLEYALIS